MSDELWAAVAPLLPPEPPKPKGGRPRCCDRRALEGIVFVLWSGIGWERLPREAFGCTGVTCWRRLRDWHAAGVLGDLRRVLLEQLAEADALDWDRASIDSASFPAKGGARRPRRRSARTPPTGAARARSGISSSTPRARRSASRLERRQPPRQQDARRRPGRRAGHAPRPGTSPLPTPASSTLTRPTTTAGAGPSVASRPSRRASRAAASSARIASGDTAGWSSARWPGSLICLNQIKRFC